MKDKPIGIFDSGVGGLTVLKEIRNLLPSEDVIYFGDTARVPYGNKSKSTIIKFSTENVLFLLNKKVKLIIIACNTSSSLALGYLKGIFSIPIIGVIEAGVKKALEISTGGKIGVIGTKSTIQSKSYEEEIKSKDKRIAVFSRSCPLFVPLVEEGILSGRIVKEAVAMYLKGFKSKNIDTVILGCTHYPLLKREISAYLNGTAIVDSAKEVARHAKAVLLGNNLLNEKNRKGVEKFYVNDEFEGFNRMAELFLKRKIVIPELVNV